MHRKATVTSYFDARVTVPMIRLRGRWLKRAGFREGDAFTDRSPGWALGPHAARRSGSHTHPFSRGALIPIALRYTRRGFFFLEAQPTRAKITGGQLGRVALARKSNEDRQSRVARSTSSALSR
jgi:hypothetical protein